MNTINPIDLYISEAYPVHNNSPRGKTLLAENADVGWSTVHKTSLGLYTYIPVKLVNYMAANPVGDADHSSIKWNEMYRAFVAKELDLLSAEVVDEGPKGKYAALFVDPKDFPKIFPSFVEWRESLSISQMDFCKTFLIHQGILNKYEDGQMKKLPQSVKDRLRYVGQSDSYIRSVGALVVKKAAV